jgi:2-polyprenyl-3-methyl-5-hydroxy-6-metoxy-1,4-benzoquinol methylase
MPIMAVTASLLCNGCQSADARLLWHGYGFDNSSESFDLYECLRCGLVRLEPPLQPAQLACYYAADYYGSPQAKFTGPLEAVVRRANVRRARTLARRVGGVGPRRVLDIGCGRGLLLRAMHELGFAAVGTELPGFAFSTAAGVHFVHATAELLPFADAVFDVVSLWHVLEHTTDPASVLREASRVLKPGGLLSLAVPNFGSWQARCFGRHWFHLDLPRHLYHFRPAPLCRMVRAQQIEVLEVRTQSWDQNLYGFLQSCLNFIFWRTAPNGLYQWLKKRQERRRVNPMRLFGYLLLGGAAVPLALVEDLVSTWRGEGATLLLTGRKVPS